MSTAGRLVGIVDLRTCARAGLSVDDVLTRTLAMGVRVVLLRGSGATLAERQAVDVERLLARVHARKGVMFVHGRDFENAAADGVHWHAGVLYDKTGSDATTSGSRGSPRRFVATGSDAAMSGSHFGVSTHSRSELGRATRIGAQWATLSPFEATASKPGYGPALGVGGLREILAGCTIPVFALAGVSASTVVGIGDAGAAGAAVMGMLTSETWERDIVALRTAMEKESWLVQPPWSLSAQG